ncbi:MAG: hypothetical protein R3B82_18245 [Sandaracinaceae bacterium]
MKDAFVTLIVGERYQRFYDRVIRPSHERLAARSGRPLVVLRAPIAGGFPHAHPSWQKLRIFEAPELAGYDRLCWLDADLYAMREAPDPFEHARDGWLAVDNDTCGSPAQAALDRLWHWPAKAAAIPDRLVNTGLFVVHRELHAALFRAVHDGWGGRWDQGPLSFHLQALEGHLASSDLNRVVVHVLADAGFGPRGLRALVERPGLVHFAAASALRGPALDYVVAADEGRRAVLRELELRSLRDALVWAGNRRWVAARRRARDRAAGPWWRWRFVATGAPSAPVRERDLRCFVILAHGSPPRQSLAPVGR